MTVIIFGANGQDGYYLNKLCPKKGYKTIRVSRSGQWLKGDVSDYIFIKQLLKHIGLHIYSIWLLIQIQNMGPYFKIMQLSVLVR